MLRMPHWESDVTDLRTLAQAVETTPAATVNARVAATCLLGVVRLVSDRFGTAVMRRVCADLVRHTPAWATKLRCLPTDAAGAVAYGVADAMEIIAASARGILEIAGVSNTRVALAFWAVENDAATMHRLVMRATA